MVLGVVKLLLGHSHSLGREMMIKSGRGSLKVGVVAKIFARFARNYTYNPTILKILDPPLYCWARLRVGVEVIVESLSQCRLISLSG